jgi:hypothetical protein
MQVSSCVLLETPSNQRVYGPAGWQEKVMHQYVADGCEQDDVAVMLLDGKYVPKVYTLTAADIRNILAAQASPDVWLDTNDAASIEQHVENDPAGCFSYQRHTVVDGKQEDHFRLGFSTNCLLASLLSPAQAHARLLCHRLLPRTRSRTCCCTQLRQHSTSWHGMASVAGW